MLGMQAQSTLPHLDAALLKSLVIKKSSREPGAEALSSITTIDCHPVWSDCRLLHSALFVKQQEYTLYAEGIR